MKRNTLFNLILGFATAGIVIGGNVASSQASSMYYSEFGVCCSEQLEVATTPFALVQGAYQGQYKDQGIPGFATFRQQVATGKITAEDLVTAAYFEYRATYDDLVGDTEFMDDVEDYLQRYSQGGH